MKGFLEELDSARPEAGSIALFWLGQAGFVLVTPEGRRIGIDPYLSDFVQHSFPEVGDGFKRLMPAPCQPEDLHLDALLISHEHADHYDAESITGLTRGHSIPVLTTPTVADLMKAAGHDKGRVLPMRPGDSLTTQQVRVTAVGCDHGELSSDAIGFLLDTGSVTLYYAGDTALTLDRLAIALQRKPDVAILPINGAFGNLDGVQASILAGALEARYCVPCHFWMFPLHLGKPQEVIDSLPMHAPGCELCLFRQGEGMVFPRRKDG